MRRGVYLWFSSPRNNVHWDSEAPYVVLALFRVGNVALTKSIVKKLLASRCHADFPRRPCSKPASCHYDDHRIVGENSITALNSAIASRHLNHQRNIDGTSELYLYMHHKIGHLFSVLFDIFCSLIIFLFK